MKKKKERKKEKARERKIIKESCIDDSLASS
jgi:hypothetical protein